MDKGRYRSGGKLWSWALAVLLIAAGAIVIGWFAGEGLMALMNRGGSASPIEEPGTEAAGGTEGLPAEEAAPEEGETPEAEQPSAAEGQAEASSGRTSPFETPPWMTDNLSIKQVEEQAAEEVLAEDQAAVETAEEPEAPEAEASEQSQKIPELYKVRVGPYAGMAEATAAAKELAKLGFPTLITLSQKYYVQIGAFSSRANAENLETKVEGYGYSATIFD